MIHVSTPSTVGAGFRHGQYILGERGRLGAVFVGWKAEKAKVECGLVRAMLSRLTMEQVNVLPR